MVAEDPRVNAFIEKDQGMYDAVNRGFRRSNGEVLAYLNCDEQYLPGALKAVGDYFPGASPGGRRALGYDCDRSRRRIQLPPLLAYPASDPDVDPLPGGELLPVRPPPCRPRLGDLF